MCARGYSGTVKKQDKKFWSRRPALINRMPVYRRSAVVVYGPYSFLFFVLMWIEVLNLEATVVITLLIVICGGIVVFGGWRNGPASAAGGGAQRSDVNGVMIEG